MSGLHLSTQAQNFDKDFEDATLRLNYIFGGNNRDQFIYLDGMSWSDGWYGRRKNLNKLPLQGNGQIYVQDAASGDTLYAYSFSTLFQEWQTTEGASKMSKSYENCFYIPKPKQPIQVSVYLTDTHNKVKCSYKHTVNPKDILIRYKKASESMSWQYLKKSGNSRDKIDVVFVPEGYTASEMNVFYKDCEESVDAMLQHEPFRSLADRFNFVMVNVPSIDSGVSIPKKNLWLRTAVGSHFDTFYSERYLTTPNVKQLYNLLDGIPCETIIILANTDNYGGGGIYNSYLLSAAHNKKSRPVVVHEFGHSFAGLADEYYYDDQYKTMYPADTEPWEPNITTKVDFESKWADMMGSKGFQKVSDGSKETYTVGLYEGAGYQSKGCYRPCKECRMKINEAPEFCPVCQRAIQRMVEFYTK